jgi:hypothetical protein
MGKVVCGKIPVEKIEIINLVSEKSTISDCQGNFTISAKSEDILVFVSTKYEYKRVFLEQDLINKNNIIVQLLIKPEELKEVVVLKMPKIKLSNNKAYEKGKLDEIVLNKLANSPKNINVGNIENGITKIFRLYRKKKEKSYPEFKEYSINIVENFFFINELKLNEDQIGLFLEFCEADPKSKTIVENYNVLSLMDFLFAKNIEFKKISAFKN